MLRRRQQNSVSTSGAGSSYDGSSRVKSKPRQKMHSAVRIYDDVDPEFRRDAPNHPSVVSTPKRLLDLLIAGVALTAGLPLAALIALLVAITSPGPVLFRQERVGLRGRRF